MPTRSEDALHPHTPWIALQGDHTFTDRGSCRDRKESSSHQNIRAVPAVVFLRASFLWIRFICAIVAQQVRRDIVDLHAGSMVQHLQVLKYCLPDLIQVLFRKKNNREGSSPTDLMLCSEPQRSALLPAYTVFVVAMRNAFVQKAIKQSRRDGKVNSITEAPALRKL